MKPYIDIDRDSGVTAYEIGPGYIRVQFRDASIFRYTDASAGSANIREMARLAVSGDGLNAFINTHVKQRYAYKEC